MSNNIGRNSLCPCGSGLKYKRCCLSSTNVKNNVYSGFEGLVNKTVAQLGNKAKIRSSEELGLPKMSVMVFDYMEDFLDQNSPLDFQKKIMQIGLLAWNISLLESQELIDAAVTEIVQYSISDRHDILAIKDLMKEMINEKNKKYPQIKRPVVSYELIESNGKIVDLQVASVVRDVSKQI